MSVKKITLIVMSSAGFLSSIFAQAQVRELEVEEVVVEGAQNHSQVVTTPAQTVNAREIDQAGMTNLGELLSTQPGIAASGFGPGASRPVMRGLEGSRVQIFQHGMSSGDLSDMSADHSPANDAQGAHQIEILRGPSALKYGSASSAGLINILNDQIPIELIPQASAIFGTSLGSVDQSVRSFASAEGSSGQIGLRADIGRQTAANYAMPNGQRLPYSYSDQTDLGFGISRIEDNGYTGISLNEREHTYGIPSVEGGKIEQQQDRIDLAHFRKNPFTGIESIDVRLGYTNYQHTEFDANNSPATLFSNRTWEGRVDFIHESFYGWHGGFGLQTSTGQFSAIGVGQGNATIIPPTNSNSYSTYLIENKSVGAFDFSLGSRYGLQKTSPNNQVDASQIYSFSGVTPNQPDRFDRQFNLFSFAASIDWNYQLGYALGLSFAQLQRAPSASELFAYGAHDSTATFEVGDSGLNIETSRNWELMWKKSTGALQGNLGVFQNNISNYIYGKYTGATDLDSGFVVSQFTQGNAMIRGIEGNAQFRAPESGFTYRTFGDVSRGILDDEGNLPLQPAARLGVGIHHQHGGWEEDLSLLHAFAQTRLAIFETVPTPAYSQLDMRVSYKARLGPMNLNIFLQGRNLLNEDIRYSTTVETLRVYAPQAGRSVILGFKGTY